MGSLPSIITIPAGPLQPTARNVPALFADAGSDAVRRFIEFFTANIRNRNTRAAYAFAAARFARWCGGRGISLAQLTPVIVAAYIEELGQRLDKPSVKQHLAALRMLFDYLVTGQVMPTNPAYAVRGPKHVVKTGRTPVLTAEETRILLDHIDVNTIAGLRDRAIIGVMVYSFARVGAVVTMNVEDYFQEGKRWWFRLHEKGGKRHEVPAHHNAEAYVDTYLTAAHIADDRKGPLFRSLSRERCLIERRLHRLEVLAMIKRRARQAGLPPTTCCHTFRATGITTYLQNGGAIEHAQQIANHESPRTTKLYDRTSDAINLDEIERIIIWLSSQAARGDHMNLIAVWIRRKPAVAFYIICYAISWTLWLPAILTRAQLAELMVAVGVIGGPALACLLVARTDPTPAKNGRPLSFWVPFITSWIVSGLVLAANSPATSAGASPALLVIFAGLALIPALVIGSAVSGPSGVRSALSSLVRPRGWWGWYVLAVVWPLASRLGGVWVSKQLGWELLSSPQVPANVQELAGPILVSFLYTLLYAGGLNEETGWTGFALPRLLAGFSPLIATIVVWALWILWHVPLHLSGYFNLSLHVLVGSFFSRFLFTYLFIRSSGGLWTAILLHTSANVTSQFVPVTNASLVLDAVVALLIVVGGRMWRRPAQESPAILGEESVVT